MYSVNRGTAAGGSCRKGESTRRY